MAWEATGEGAHMTPRRRYASVNGLRSATSRSTVLATRWSCLRVRSARFSAASIPPGPLAPCVLTDGQRGHPSTPDTPIAGTQRSRRLVTFDGGFA
jgi:hypothetical protein